MLPKNIVPSRSDRCLKMDVYSEIAHFCDKLASPAPILVRFYVSNGILYIDLGAGKHPSPLDISESYSPDLYLKVGFYLIKKYCSCPKLSQFKDQ